MDAGSPAERASIRVKTVKVVAINGLPTEHSTANEGVQEVYRCYVGVPQPSTIFPSDNGFERNMYWSVDKYLRVAEAIQKPEHKAVFSYLFSHIGTYIHSPIIKELVFEVKRGGNTEPILITPISIIRLHYPKSRVLPTMKNLLHKHYWGATASTLTHPLCTAGGNKRCPRQLHLPAQR